LPASKAAVDDKLTVMLDRRVRRGAEMLIAFRLGAQFVFFVRTTLYGAAAGGPPGVNKVDDIFRGEIDLVMGQIGCPSLDQVAPDFLWRGLDAEPVMRPLAQLPAVCTTGLAAPAGRSSALSISSNVRPLVSGPNTQKPMMPRTSQDAK
jgi:hypothetical protein